MSILNGWEAVSAPTAASSHASSVSRATETANVAAQKSQQADVRAVRQAREDFTAMVLQSFLEAAVPKNLTGTENPSAAGGMYRSLLVEQLAKSVAASGQFNVFGDVADQRLVDPSGAALLSPRPANKTE